MKPLAKFEIRNWLLKPHNITILGISWTPPEGLKETIVYSNFRISFIAETGTAKGLITAPSSFMAVVIII